MSDYRDLLTPETRARLLAREAGQPMDSAVFELPKPEPKKARPAPVVHAPKQVAKTKPITRPIVKPALVQPKRVEPKIEPKPVPVKAKTKAATYSGEFTWDDIRISTMRNTGNFRCDSSV